MIIREYILNLETDIVHSGANSSQFCYSGYLEDDIFVKILKHDKRRLEITTGNHDWKSFTVLLRSGRLLCVYLLASSG